MKVLKQQPILNDDGSPILLTRQEQHLASLLQRQCNEKFQNTLGYEIPITTLTTVLKKVSQQKFFEIPPAEYVPVRVGEGAWSTSITSYRAFDAVDDFSTGIINMGGQNGRLAVADTGVDALSVRVFNWAKAIGWTIFELETAIRAGNWDVVTAKEEARKRNWDLGVQKIAFLGAAGLNGVGGAATGLLNQPGVLVNTSLITKPISSMSPTELSTLLQNIIELYRAGNGRTAWPTAFIIPESDYNGLAAQASPTFPMKTILALLQESLALITRNPNFKVLPLAYGDKRYSGYNYQTYVLLNQDDNSIRMTIPVDYNSTLQNSIDNFSFQNVGYGQFTGVLTLRPTEIMYFQY